MFFRGKESKARFFLNNNNNKRNSFASIVLTCDLSNPRNFIICERKLGKEITTLTRNNKK